ncbi:MAG: ribonuclease PH [Candidatus Brocadiia bacterium]
MSPRSAPRADGRGADALRPVAIRRRYTSTPQGSVLIRLGNTQVLCTAMVEEGVPRFLDGTRSGWVTAEYAMLPGSTRQRKPRDSYARLDARGVEIRRLIGRVLRAVVCLPGLAGHTVWLDCDVLEADGSTRTAAITGAYVALADATAWMRNHKLIPASPLRAMVAAVSVGILDGQPALDLCYGEDAAAAVDMNVAMTDRGQLVELQGTGEQRTFTRPELGQMLDLAEAGTRELFECQTRALRWKHKPWEAT